MKETDTLKDIYLIASKATKRIPNTSRFQVSFVQASTGDTVALEKKEIEQALKDVSFFATAEMSAITNKYQNLTQNLQKIFMPLCALRAQAEPTLHHEAVLETHLKLGLDVLNKG